MYNSACARCRAARAGGYVNGCAVHRGVSAPATVVVERHHHTPTVVVVEDCDAAGSLFVDSSGHLSENLGGGVGMDLVNGDLTVDGIDVGGDSGGSCGGDW
jgi:hypothetical protein